MRKTLLLCLFVFLAAGCVTYVSREQDYQIARIDLNRAAIIGYSGSAENIRIPQIIQGAVITEIGNGAFAGAGLSNVILPQSIVLIGNDAFRENRLAKIAIPINVTSIGEGAFRDNLLTEISFSGNITIIRKDAFRGNRLTQVRIPPGVINIDMEAFTENNINKITIGNDVNIAPTAFDNYFAAIYSHQDRKAGTYIFSNKTWRRQ